MSGSAPRTTRKAATNAPSKKLWKRSTKYARKRTDGETSRSHQHRRPARRRRWSSISRISTRRIRRISIPHSTETGLFWSPDSTQTRVHRCRRGEARHLHGRDPRRSQAETADHADRHAGTLAETGQSNRLAVERAAGEFPARRPASRRSELKTGETAGPAKRRLSLPGSSARRVEPAQSSGLRSVLAHHARHLVRRAPRQPRLAGRPSQVHGPGCRQPPMPRRSPRSCS